MLVLTQTQHTESVLTLDQFALFSWTSGLYSFLGLSPKGKAGGAMETIPKGGGMPGPGGGGGIPGKPGGGGGGGGPIPGKGGGGGGPDIPGRGGGGGGPGIPGKGGGGGIAALPGKGGGGGGTGMVAWPGKGGGGGGGMNPTIWPGSGGAGGGGGKPGVGTGTVIVTTLSLASSRSLESFSICREVKKACYRLDLASQPTYCTYIAAAYLHRCDACIHTTQIIEIDSYNFIL